MKRILSILLVVSTFYLQAFDLTPENREEIDACWRRIFNEEMLSCTASESRALKKYRNHLLALQADDMHIAGQLIARLCKGDLWDIFAEEKSVDVTVAYIKYLMKALNRFVGDDAMFKFPPKLSDIRAYTRAYEHDKKTVCAKMRQAFLAFTIIVSKMDYMATH